VASQSGSAITPFRPEPVMGLRRSCGAASARYLGCQALRLPAGDPVPVRRGAGDLRGARVTPDAVICLLAAAVVVMSAGQLFLWRRWRARDRRDLKRRAVVPRPGPALSGRLAASRPAGASWLAPGRGVTITESAGPARIEGARHARHLDLR
jgi:hypothetical protein